MGRVSSAGALPSSASNASFNTAALGYLGYSNAVCNYYVQFALHFAEHESCPEYTLTFFARTHTTPVAALALPVVRATP